MTTILIILGVAAAATVAIGTYNPEWFLLPGDCAYQAIWYVTAPPRPNISFVGLSLEDAKKRYDEYWLEDHYISGEWYRKNKDGTVERGPQYWSKEHYFYLQDMDWNPQNDAATGTQTIDVITRIPQIWCNGCCGTLRLFVDENGIIKDEKWISTGFWTETRAQIN